MFTQDELMLIDHSLTNRYIVLSSRLSKEDREAIPSHAVIAAIEDEMTKLLALHNKVRELRK